MPKPPPSDRGQAVRNPPTGFPAFFDGRKPRVVTADPWAFISHLAADELAREQERIASAYIEQAYDFYQAAENPHIGSKPLLYYYSFLNLVKAGILIRGMSLPPTATHGISEARANVRTRLRFEGQAVNIHARASNRSAVLPEFLHLLGHSSPRQRTFKLLQLLGQVPSVHRTFTKVTGQDPNFLPIRRVELEYAEGYVWARLVLSRRDKDVLDVLPVLRKRREFQARLYQVQAQDSSELWFETDFEPGDRRGLDNGIKRLVKQLRELDVAAILTSSGYRFYLTSLTAGSRLPYLAASYAVAFYLGSVTRYKPHDFDKIIAGGYRWLVEEFLATQPMQFIYGLASELAGVDVVRPYAVTH